MCKNAFINSQEQLQDLILKFGDLYPDHTAQEITAMASQYAAYFNSPKAVRTAHIDLSTPCTFHMKDDGTPKSINAQKQRAKKNLEEHVGMAKPFGAKWHVAHLCEHGSNSATICTNPLHLYFGTPKENHADVDRLGNPTGALKTVETNRKNQTGAFHNPKERLISQRKGGVKGSKAQLAAGTHNTVLKNKQCRFCFDHFTSIHINRHEHKCAREHGLKSYTPRATRTNPNPEEVFFS